MWGTLRVVTARELVVLSGSCTSHSKSARRLRHFTWSCEPREIHSLQCWKARNKSPQAYPARTGDWTRGRRVTGAHATTCTIATLLTCCSGDWALERIVRYHNWVLNGIFHLSSVTLYTSFCQKKFGSSYIITPTAVKETILPCIVWQRKVKTSS